MLSCKEITEIVTDYLEGRLTLADRMRFQMHLGMCKHCRAYLRQMKATVAVLGQLSEDAPMPDEVRDELRKRFADWRTSRADGGEKKNQSRRNACAASGTGHRKPREAPARSMR